MAPLGETIAVIDKSGKVVSTSKHLFGVFSQAKNAYRERKAQVQSERNAKIAEREALKALQNYHIDDAPSVASSRRSRSRHHSGRSHYTRGGSLYEEDVHWRGHEADSYYDQPREMVRRHTHHDVGVRDTALRPVPVRSRSDAPHVDMDLAYGEFHPSALEAQAPNESQLSPQQGQLQRIEDPELNGLVTRAQWLLEEADCMQHTATATIAHLQKNPESMAAVALTLAEISNLVTKLAPSALGALKAAAPSVFALLASPQFLIAAGVGLGVTIVMFGGYKIIKQIQSSTTSKAPVLEAPQPQIEEPSMEDLMELNTECLSSVEMWRRGVADAEADSAGTSVDGEFITPTAAMMSGIDVTTARMTRDPRFKYDDDDYSMASSRRSRRSRAHHGHSRADHRPDSYVGSKAPSRAPSKSESRHTDSKKPKEKTKRSSRLRLMFTT
ncbi:uncharacterized protein BO97DRAFT_44936 [Aspergillus homomorphus CBS 101889]|uniref:Uncharacterized protein n=1 Tax=Aspergillus homomorphus (strain CBS 101889) TaxID=1450537 RepID=A0A395I465_ASPHC|nr:hypothetical protein BO97DRAFT_44936 [Aspergillus homomorphus CBS 101889]RAL13184.1 hypothetical protein BO97DRAFT_44936 [Aspergillus homomorphus CBS 101889]